MKSLLLDTEYNNIRAELATKIWCIVATDVDTGEKFKFHPSEEGEDQFHDQFKDEFVKFVQGYDHFIGHNYWAAEAVVCKNLLGIDFKDRKVTDTLVLSRTLRPAPAPIEQHGDLKAKGLDTRNGNHSLEAWGKRLGFAKIEFDKFDRFSFEMLDYCERDVDLNVKVLEVLNHEIKTYEFSQAALDLEHDIHRILTNQAIAGFTLNVPQAKELALETDKLIEEYLARLHEVFPDKKTVIEVYKPKLKKDGELPAPAKKKLLKNLHEDNGDGSYTLYEMVEFNPKSPSQVADRLLDLGWNPRKYTATGQPSTGKDVIGEAIDQLAAKVPQVEVLRKYNIVYHKNQLAKEWLKLAESDGKVHGRCNHIGPWTHRSSHYEPNQGNITKVRVGPDKKPLKGLQGDFGYESRNCWLPRKGWVLVGCDAEGIQLRALAHYMEDPEYIKAVCEGDVHTKNQIAAGIKANPVIGSARDVSKRFAYAWLLGAGDEKIGVIVGAPQDEWDSLFSRAKAEFRWNKWRHKGYREARNEFDNMLFWVSDKLRSDGRKADKQTVATILKGYYTKKQFLEATPALAHFRQEVIPEAARRGYMMGMDGRKIWVPSEHLAMGAYLQGFEAVIMKHAMKIYHDVLESKGIPFQQVVYVHDELQTECPPEHAEEVGKTMAWAIEEAGRRLGSKSPLAGKHSVGNSWATTH